jgi:Cu-Zn family superoxide dismutase
VRTVIDVGGLSPGKHGAHVHEKGDCSAHDAKSAGEHFNPEGHPHGLPPREPRHIGDFGNIEVGEDGRGHLDTVAPGANLRENDPHSFVGRAMVIHAKPDDGSQPSGNAGERIGCGEIRP